MFTTWEQVREWIEDNNFPHWIFFTKKPDDRDKSENDKVIDSNNFTVSDMEDKLSMTEKYLRMYGGKLYGLGFKTPNSTNGGFLCEVRLDGSPISAQPVGMASQVIDEDKIAQRVEAKIRAEYERKEYERKSKELDADRKAFEEEKASAMGAIAYYLGPIGRAILQGKGLMRDVAGLDSKNPVEAQPITPAPGMQQNPTNGEPAMTEEIHEESAWDMFTDEQGERIAQLMARWMKAEPDCLDFLEKIVVMAENGDIKYQMAKSAL